MKSVRTSISLQAAALSVSVRAYTYRTALSLCFVVLIGYGIIRNHSFVGLFFLSIVQLVFCADVLWKSAYQDISHGKFTLSVLAGTSLLAACAYNVSKTFLTHPLAGAVPNLYFVLSVLISCYLMIELCTVRHKERTQVFIKKLEEVLPKSARVYKANREQMVFAHELHIGDQIRVRAGEMIPCEGTIIKGESYIEESFITGNMLPTSKTVGSQVYAGTLNQGAEIWIKVERLLKDSVMAGIVRAIQTSEKQRCVRQNPLDQYTFYLWIGTICVAILGYSFVYWAGNYTRPLHSLGIFLLALGLGCPISFFFAALLPQICLLAGAKRKHIHIQVVDALSKLAKADLIFLDKTGTLTDGKLSVAEICPSAQSTKQELLDCIISAEQMVENPFAIAMQQYAHKYHLQPKPVVCFDVYPGLGVRAICGKEVLLVGRIAFLRQQGVRVKQNPQAEQAIICAAKNGKYLGYVSLVDTLRVGAQEMISALNQRPAELILMSGDTQASVQAVAAQMGIEKINFGVLPQTKAEVIANYKALGKTTVMIGDGFNDMAALLKADAGIVFASGKNIYNQWVDIVIDRPDLYSIKELFSLYKRLKNCTYSNVWWSFLYNILVLIALIRLPQTFWQEWFVLPLALAISVLLLLLNSMRLLHIK